ncbi:MAG: tetratricopeptide repeat protein [Bdellovibrionaceae bacterium]|nr:tetratricopeptide repeat protein [Pseudobdellovibrionaceae bacterium]
MSPKSEEQIAKEKRIQAELERQKKETETLDQLKNSLPEYQSQEIEGYKGFVNNTVNDLNRAKDILQSSGAIAPDPNLPKTKEGVPYFLLSKIERVPKLNVGREATVTSDQFMVKDYALGIDKYKESKALRSPESISLQEIEKWTKKQIIVITEEKKLERKEFGIRDVVTEDKIQKLTVVPKVTLDKYMDYKKFTKSELKMLAAMILYQKGNKCHMVAGLFDDLSKTDKQSKEANYYLGICSVEMGFHSEAVKRLLPFIKSEDSEYATSAMETLAKTLPREYEVSFYEVIKDLKSAALIKAAMQDKIKYLQAKGAYKKGHYNAAVEAASVVGKASEFYPSAQFIIATSHYNRGRVQEAVDIYRSLDKLIAEGNDENLQTLVSINLARIAFQSEKYKTALSFYQKMKKNHPLWVQALIEQGWTQIMVGDYPGAIGNMYSLHSPYFKSVFMPESWAVRTIGYLNICQYGDAYNSLTKLEKSYGQWYKDVENYKKNNKLAKNYYFTVVNYLKR